MRYIFYYYNHFGTLVFDYYDDKTHVTQSYVFYTLKQAVSTFSRRRFTSLPLDMYNIYPLIHRIVTTQVSITSPTANNNIATLIGTLLFDFSSFLPISSDQTSL